MNIYITHLPFCPVEVCESHLGWHSGEYRNVDLDWESLKEFKHLCSISFQLPGGSFNLTKSLSLLKCLNCGAMTSRTANSMSTFMGKSSDMATVALNCLLLAFATTLLPRVGGLPGTLDWYSAQVTPEFGGGGRLGLRATWAISKSQHDGFEISVKWCPVFVNERMQLSSSDCVKNEDACTNKWRITDLFPFFRRSHPNYSCPTLVEALNDGTVLLHSSGLFTNHVKLRHQGNFFNLQVFLTEMFPALPALQTHPKNRVKVRPGVRWSHFY